MEGIETKIILSGVHDRRRIQDEPVLERQRTEMRCDLCELGALYEQHDQAKSNFDHLDFHGGHKPQDQANLHQQCSSGHQIFLAWCLAT